MGQISEEETEYCCEDMEDLQNKLADYETQMYIYGNNTEVLEDKRDKVKDKIEKHKCRKSKNIAKKPENPENFDDDCTKVYEKPEDNSHSPMVFFGLADASSPFADELKQEAIKWVKYLNSKAPSANESMIWWIKKFFNITKKDLK
jgi:hypothetical protein